MNVHKTFRRRPGRPVSSPSILSWLFKVSDVGENSKIVDENSNSASSISFVFYIVIN